MTSHPVQLVLLPRGKRSEYTCILQCILPCGSDVGTAALSYACVCSGPRIWTLITLPEKYLQRTSSNLRKGGQIGGTLLGFLSKCAKGGQIGGILLGFLSKCAASSQGWPDWRNITWFPIQVCSLIPRVARLEEYYLVSYPSVQPHPKGGQIGGTLLAASSQGWPDLLGFLSKCAASSQRWPDWRYSIWFPIQVCTSTQVFVRDKVTESPLMHGFPLKCLHLYTVTAETG